MFLYTWVNLVKIRQSVSCPWKICSWGKDSQEICSAVACGNGVECLWTNCWGNVFTEGLSFSRFYKLMLVSHWLDSIWRRAGRFFPKLIKVLLNEQLQAWSSGCLVMFYNEMQTNEYAQEMCSTGFSPCRLWLCKND